MTPTPALAKKPNEAWTLTFSNLDKLKVELEKIENLEKRSQLEQIIAKSLKLDQDKQFVIEFTEFEWNQLQIDEKLDTPAERDTSLIAGCLSCRLP